MVSLLAEMRLLLLTRKEAVAYPKLMVRVHKTKLSKQTCIKGPIQLWQNSLTMV
jgi:hypothetical protein